MAKIDNSSQRSCNKNVQMFHFIQDGNEAEICSTIQSIMEKHNHQKIYIGISCHPCGRYTGDYAGTTALPRDYQMEVNHEEINANILEAAHESTYNNMYVIFSHNNLERIRKLETEAIECVKNHNIKQSANRNDGGGGRDAETVSDTYFLYVCTSAITLD